jgi:hypothetical protein
MSQRRGRGCPEEPTSLSRERAGDLCGTLAEDFEQLAVAEARQLAQIVQRYLGGRCPAEGGPIQAGSPGVSLGGRMRGRLIPQRMAWQPLALKAGIQDDRGPQGSVHGLPGDTGRSVRDSPPQSLSACDWWRAI